jgi:hypothetical protein
LGKILELNTTTNQTSLVSGSSVKYAGGVLAPNGKIYFVDMILTNIRVKKSKSANLIGTDAQYPQIYQL